MQAAIWDISTTDLADEGKCLPPHPLGTVAEPDGELVDEVQAQIISTTCIQLLEDLHNLRTQVGIIDFKMKVFTQSVVNVTVFNLPSAEASFSKRFSKMSNLSNKNLARVCFPPTSNKNPDSLSYTHQFVRDPPDLWHFVRTECERYLSEVVIHIVVAVQLYDQDQLPGRL